MEKIDGRLLTLVEILHKGTFKHSSDRSLQDPARAQVYDEMRVKLLQLFPGLGESVRARLETWKNVDPQFGELCPECGTMYDPARANPYCICTACENIIAPADDERARYRDAMEDMDAHTNRVAAEEGC